MREKLINLVLPYFVKSVLNTFDEKQLKKMLDTAIDQLEDVIELSPNKLDDNLLPVIFLLRNVFDIPDNDDTAAAFTKKA